ncbi:MAG TPA: acyl-CoA dehydrogenase family protein [Acidimicrobiales bacterium]|nr:acyl-CoA dehydrogenase family protein [Acidimicrobiales bacterium]
MDLGLSEDQELLRETTARFIQARCPLQTVRELSETDTGADAQYARQAAELGWFAMLVPEQDGGGSVSGRGVVDAAIVAVERGRYLQPSAFVPGNVVAWALGAQGNEDQRAKVLPAIVGGETVVTWALADPSGSWEPGAGVRVEERGGGFSLNGTKGLVQDAHLADWLLVTAGSEGSLTQFLVPGDAPGMKVTILDGLDLTRRFCTVDFTDVQVPASSVVGEAGGAAPAIERQLQIALVLALAESVGAMDRDFEVALDYAKVRTAFGRPIGSFQAVKHLLADTSLLLETSKALVAAAADAVQDRTDDTAEVVSMAKAFVGDSGIELAHNCFQTFGGIGFTWEHDQHLYLRRLTADADLYGDPSWHRERLCRVHGF